MNTGFTGNIAGDLIGGTGNLDLGGNPFEELMSSNPRLDPNLISAHKTALTGNGLYNPAVLKELPDLRREAGEAERIRVWAYLALYEGGLEETREEAAIETVEPREATLDPEDALLEAKRIAPKTEGVEIQKVKGGKPKGFEDKPEPSDAVWSFLSNPSQMKFTGGDADYAEAVPHLASAPYLQYKGNTPEILEIDDILLECWCEGKSLMPLLDGLDKLKRISLGVASGADDEAKSKAKFEPPTLSFVWGERRFEPCKLISATWNESRWIDGVPAGGRLSLRFQKIPDPERLPENPLSYPLVEPEDIGDAPEELNLIDTEPFELTERQLEDAREAAQEGISERISRYREDIQEILRGDGYHLVPSTDGIVRLYDATKAEIGVVGQYRAVTGSDEDTLFVTDGISDVPESDTQYDNEDEDE
jgi:hypothetical protein